MDDVNLRYNQLVKIVGKDKIIIPNILNSNISLETVKWRWYAINTAAYTKAKASFNLVNQNFNIYFPQI